MAVLGRFDRPDFRVTLAKLRLPPSQQHEAFLRIANLVGKIIRPAAIGIDIAKMLTEMPGQQEAGDREIFVVLPRESATILSRLTKRHFFPRRRVGTENR
jgi:hypothetical protein